MEKEVTAMLVSNDEDLLRTIKQTLETLEIKIDIARSYEQARSLLEHGACQ